MATLGELNILVKLKGADQVSGGLNDLSKNLKRLRTDLGQLENALKSAGIAITGTFAAAFKVASKEIPSVNKELNKFTDASKELSVTLAKAALPALKDVTNVITSVSNVLRNVNPKIVEATFRFGLMAVSIASVTRIVRSFISLLVFITRPIGLMVAALSAIVALFIHFREEIVKALPFLKGLFDAMDAVFGSSGPLERSKSVLQEFGTGFSSELRKLRDEVADFGKSVANALDKALGDTLFNLITGRVTDLKSILQSLGEDILKAFTKGVSNQFLGFLFGNSGGGSGVLGKMFPGLANLLGFATDDPTSELKKKTDEVAEKFDALSINMDKFAAAKDRAIEALQGGAQGGAVAGPAGFAASMISPISPETLNSATMLSGIFGTMSTAVEKVRGGIRGMGMDMVKAIFQGVGAAAAANAAVIALGMVTAAITTAVTVAAASAISAAWLPAALFASIATLGVAAGVGGAALAGSVGVLGAVGASAAAVSKAAFGGNQGLALPAGAGIQMGAGGGIDGVQAFAEGGIVRKPTLGLIGEAGPEAVVPLGSNGGGGFGNTIVINSDVVLADDPSSVDRFVRAIEDGLIRRSNRRTGGTAISF